MSKRHIYVACKSGWGNMWKICNTLHRCSQNSCPTKRKQLITRTTILHNIQLVMSVTFYPVLSTHTFTLAKAVHGTKLAQYNTIYNGRPNSLEASWEGNSSVTRVGGYSNAPKHNAPELQLLSVIATEWAVYNPCAGMFVNREKKIVTNSN